jgi:hypothetical protein
LEEDAAAENQHPGDVAGDIAALRPLDDAADLGVVDALAARLQYTKVPRLGPA